MICAKTGLYRYTLEVDDDLQTYEIPYYYNVIEEVDGTQELYIAFNEVFENSVSKYIPTDSEVDIIRGKIKALLSLGLSMTDGGAL